MHIAKNPGYGYLVIFQYIFLKSSVKWSQALKQHVCLDILVTKVMIASKNMAKSLISLLDWAPQFLDQGSGFQIRQGLVNAFQDESFLNTIVIVTFIVSYGIALQIAISLAFRKYPLYKLLTEFGALIMNLPFYIRLNIIFLV